MTAAVMSCMKGAASTCKGQGVEVRGGGFEGRVVGEMSSGLFVKEVHWSGIL